MQVITLDLITTEDGRITTKNNNDDLTIFEHCSNGNGTVSRETFFSKTRLLLELHGVKYTLDGYPQ